MRYTKILLAAALLVSAAPAMAADMDEPVLIEATDEYQPVEVGSGWYLRGDIGYAFSHPFEHDESLPGFTDDSSLFTGTVGMGYHINDWVRAELSASILPSNKFGDQFVTACEGTLVTTRTLVATGDLIDQTAAAATRGCEGSNNGSNKAYSVMVGGFIDLGTYSGFTPYVGAGAGIVYSKFVRAFGARDCVESTSSSTSGGVNTTQNFNCDSVAGYDGAVTSEGSYDFGYSLAAGLSYKVTDNVSIDVGYEYFSVPDAQYVAYDGGTFGIHKGIDYQTVKVGFRYDLW